MDVFLVRHAIAYERNRARWPDDSRRTLTPAGRKRFQRAARGLATCLPKSFALLTSPYVRARDTAAILAKAARRTDVIECPELGSGEPAHKAFELLRTRKEKAVVLVGHEPNLGTLLAAALVDDGARVRVEFKKGGAACLRFTGSVEAGRGTLVWLLPPRVLRALG